LQDLTPLFAWRGAGVDPEKPTVEMPSAATHSPIVTRLSRCGLSQRGPWAWRYARAPEAPAAAAIAQAAHMTPG
jgi:hypothetical protein